MPVKFKPKEKKKEPEKPKAPAKPEVPIFRGPKGTTTGFTTPKGKTFLGPISKEEEAGIQQRFAPEQARVAEREALIQEEQRKREVPGLIGTEQLGAELEQKILEPPSLEPTPITERVGGVGLAPSVFLGNIIGKGLEKAGIIEGFTPQQAKELATTRAGKALGTATAGTGVALAGALLAPYVATLAAKIAIPKAIIGTGGSATILKGAIAGLAIYTIGPGVFDYRGDEMDILRQGLKKVVEDGERIEAAVRNGFPNSDSIQLLTAMSEEVSSAEARIKHLGNNNINYRVSKEYILDTQNVRSAREAILRRVLAVENIALTGQASLNPEELMFNVAQFKS